MDSTAITILGVIILLLCIWPFIAISRNRKKREEIFIKSLTSLAERSNCKISEHEIWNKRAIGIDKDACKLFYIKKASDNIDQREISLSEIEKCRVIKTQRAVGNGKESYSVIDKLELSFEFRDKRNPGSVLDFYNTTDDSLTPRDELQLSEKWVEISNSFIAIAKPSLIKQ